MRKDLAARMLRLGRTLRNVQRLASAELSSPVSAPLRTRLWSWRRGFLTRSTKHYGATEDSRHLFVSDWARFVKTPRINGQFAFALDNKIVFSRILASYGCTIPEYYCLIRDGGMFQIGDTYRMRSPSDVVEACLAGAEFIVKPYTGGGGLRVMALTSDDGRLSVNWEERAREDVEAVVSRISDGVVSQFLHQHEYASRIFPRATNTIRMLTMWDYDAGEPFLAFAGHRFGTNLSVPVDNCSQGGLASPIDLETGELSAAESGNYEDEHLMHDEHPDTGERIRGVRVPRWDATVEGLLAICKRMAYIPYVGWDVLITPDGFAVTEGNSCPDLGHQTFTPLLKDPRVRAFYERFGAL